MMRWAVIILFCSTLGMCNAQSTPACAGFATDGSAALGTIRAEVLTMYVERPGLLPVVLKRSIRGTHCEVSFSMDGKWLAYVLKSEKLVVLVIDRASGSVYASFSLPWNCFHSYPLEPAYASSFLAGFGEDDSLTIWRYVPQASSDLHDASRANLHMQQWSLEGLLLSERDLGPSAQDGRDHTPLSDNSLDRIWLPDPGCNALCFRVLTAPGDASAPASPIVLPSKLNGRPVWIPGTNHLLAIEGTDTVQQANVFDQTGAVLTGIPLSRPFNLLGPLVPEWFYIGHLEPASDGAVAVFARLLVAWVLVDTDRDFGSEIVLLNLHPLSTISTLNVGKGGVGALAVDHRNRQTRIVGFWHDRWHNFTSDDLHPVAWKEDGLFKSL